jgi:hypothetical protein
MSDDYADLGIAQSIFSPAARRTSAPVKAQTLVPRRWAKNGLD